MKETIHICEKRDNGKLAIIAEKVLFIELDEQRMELYTQYNHKHYKIEGQFNFQYIVL